ncbi:MAG: hypothetical protein COW47_00235 [Candidatus Huberarchaeum crystalense]|uniref:Uncharacterized protein n=1 Tax=Huberarchaeum crystalense TaxID=2014257 RepID=A0A2G9LJA3_HUBC1|nr:MAG: hypothetical protein COW69_01125 [Candidatus Huberarchaeum crystalense]PIV13839.1 MAG: hypothetical protein COS45_00775 [Candidatus Huberarchaeum crystalense]PIV46488.1 MAG: hypothetical protein COS22_01060 [Candidatus Huberarchaeum crystalense]PIV89904.1 MAG: hypothetical protein COW47_00235 [Candidatus Huberarchaeum crystalense]PIX28127.1 MAG: hypothetical protein COZ66_01130 [Candidatus Huberarchaeum crystalense]
MQIEINEQEIPKDVSGRYLAIFVLKTFGIINNEKTGESDIKMLLAFVKYAKLEKPLSAEELSQMSGLKLAAAYKHINKFLDAEIIKKVDGTKYSLSESTLENTIKWHISKNVEKTLNNVSVFAAALDAEISKEF